MHGSRRRRREPCILTCVVRQSPTGPSPQVQPVPQALVAYSRTRQARMTKQ